MRCVSVVVTGRWQQQLSTGCTGGPLSIRHYINTFSQNLNTTSMSGSLAVQDVMEVLVSQGRDMAGISA